MKPQIQHKAIKIIKNSNSKMGKSIMSFFNFADLHLSADVFRGYGKKLTWNFLSEILWISNQYQIVLTRMHNKTQNNEQNIQKVQYYVYL